VNGGLKHPNFNLAVKLGGWEYLKKKQAKADRGAEKSDLFRTQKGYGFGKYGPWPELF